MNKMNKFSILINRFKQFIINKMFSNKDREEEAAKSNLELENCLANAKELSDHCSSSENIEERFHYIRVNVPQFETKDQEKKEKKIQKFLEDVSLTVFSKGYKLFKANSLTKSQMRTFISQNMIYNLLNLINSVGLHNKQIKFINLILKSKIIPFLLTTYPKYDSTQVNIKLDETVMQVNKSESNQNDLIFKSGVKFKWKQSGQYYKEIMQFINYLILLPKTTFFGGGEKQLGKNFEKFIEQIFNSCCENEANQTKKGPSNKEQKAKIMRSTIFEYGQKISENTDTFSKEELEEEMISIKNTTIMRILMKWCEELQNNMKQKNIYEQHQPFRMLDGGQRHIQTKYKDKLANFLQQQELYIENFKEEFIENIENQQQNLSKEIFKEKQLPFLNQEYKVGLFASIMLKNSHLYILSYLNRLIHGLLSAMKKCDQKEENTPQLVNFNIGDLLRCRITTKENMVLALHHNFKMIHSNQPKLLKIIKIKNKLRTETKNILINLMFMERIVVEIQLGIFPNSGINQSSCDMNHLIYELERTQFDPITELCNIWMSSNPIKADFYTKIKNQMQKNNSYQAEMHTCENFKIKNQKKKYLPFKCGFCKNYFNEFPFVESYKKCRYCQKNICIYCQIKSVKDYKEMRVIFPDFPQEKKEQFQIKKVMKYIQKQVPEYGLIISLNKKRKKYRNIKKIKRNGRILLMEMSETEEKKFSIIGELDDQKEIKKFNRNNVMIEIKDNERKKKIQEMMSMSELNRNFFIPKLVSELAEKNISQLYLQKCNLDNESLKKIENEKNNFSHIKKINFRNNQITDPMLVSRIFPKAQSIILSYNNIQKIDDKYFEEIKNVTELFLDHNKIQFLPENIGKLKKLKELNIGGNEGLKGNESLDKICEIKSLQRLNLNDLTLPKDLFKLKNIKSLHFKGSFISENVHICEDILEIDFSSTNIKKSGLFLKNFKNLTVLNISNSTLKKVPTQIGSCVSLKILSIDKCNQIQELPKELKNLKQLTELDFSQTNISLLPCMGKWNQLKILKAKKSRIQGLPDTIKSCTKLQILNIGSTYIKEFTQSMAYLINLRELNIEETPISEISSIGENYKKLQKLNLSNLKLQKLPDNIQNLHSLFSLSISNSSFDGQNNFPECILSLELKTLQLNHFFFKSLPFDKAQFRSTLTNLFLEDNELQTFPQQIISLKKLKILSLKNNKISKLPDKIKHLNYLRCLYLDENRFSVIPDQIQSMNNLQTISFTKVQIPEESLQKHKIVIS